MVRRWRGRGFSLAADGEVGHFGGSDQLFPTMRGCEGEHAIFQSVQLAIQDDTATRGEHGGLGIEVDALDLREIHVGDAAIFVGILQPLVKQAEDLTFSSRAVLELDHVRPGADESGETQAGKQYSLHSE